MHPVLVATLGAEPQVVPLATALLLAAGPLDAVHLVHTNPDLPPIGTALPAVIAAFDAHAGWPPLRCTPLAIDDVLDPSQLDAFAEGLFSVLRHWVTQDARVHLLLAGGRKSMTMVGMSVAQQVLGPADRVWYLHSDEALRQSQRMQAVPGDAVRLVPIPLPHLAVAPPALTRALREPTRVEALAALEQQRQALVEHFLHHELTAAERELALLVAKEVLTAAELAARLHKRPKTITNQLNSIYSKLESVFGLFPDRGIKREFLRQAVAGERGERGSQLP